MGLIKVDTGLYIQIIDTILIIKICGYASVLNFYVGNNLLTDIGSKEL
jgi:hypothetical protein